MKTIILYLICLIVLTRTSISFAELSDNDKAYIKKVGIQAKVLEVINPVTYLIKSKDGEVIVRLMGLSEDYNIPDYHLLEIQAFLEHTLINKDVFIVYDELDKEGLKVLKAFIYYPKDPDLLINAVLLYRGYARINPEEKHRFSDEFQDLERLARSKGFGIWIDINYNRRNISQKTKDIPLTQEEKLLREIYFAKGDQLKIDGILKKYNVDKKELPELFTKWSKILNRKDSIKKLTQQN